MCYWLLHFELDWTEELDKVELDDDLLKNNDDVEHFLNWQNHALCLYVFYI